MGLLSWLFGETSTPRQSTAVYTTLEEKHVYEFEIVGESHYQEQIRAIVHSAKSPDDVFDARLIPEPDNPYDKNAVRVEIQKRTVGYLSRASAKVYRKAYGEKTARCQVRIFGGEYGRHFGVFLEAPEEPEEQEPDSSSG